MGHLRQAILIDRTGHFGGRLGIMSLLSRSETKEAIIDHIIVVPPQGEEGG